MNITFHPILPVWLIVLGALALLAALAYGSRVLRGKNIPRRWIAGLAALRILAAILFLLCLLRPSVTYRRAVTRGPDLLIMLDVSRSMGRVDAGAEAPRLTRTVKMLTGAAFRERVLDYYSPYWFAFDRNARPVQRRELDELQPTGDTTQYGESLSTVWSFYRQLKDRENAAGPPPCRVLLVSDGLDRGARDVVELARSYGVPIDTLAPAGAGAERESASVQIAGVQTPRRVLLGSESRLLVTLRQTRANQLPLTLTLSEDEQPIVRQELAFAAGENERHLTLAFRPASIGIKKYALRLAPREAAAAVRTPPPYEISVKVESRKNEVLFLEDAWRWEFKFLRRIFENDPSFAFTAFLSRGSGLYMQFGEPDRRVTLSGFPQSRTELAWFDTFVLGDVNPGRWPKALAAALYQLVAEEGKSLIVLAGPNIGRLAQVPELRALLPVDIGGQQARPIPGPVADRVSLEGRVSPLFFNPPGAGGLEQRWPNLPPMDQIYPVIRKRPAATVLVEAANQANEYGNLIIAAEHTVGRGRVLLLATDTLWKWQMNGAMDNDGNTPYSVFWQQALRALQPARLAVGNANLWIQPNRSQYAAGQTVALTLDVESDRPLTRPAVEADVTLPDGRKIPLTCVAQPAQLSRYLSEFQATLPGAYQIGATLIAEGRPIADAGAVVDVLKPEPETAPKPVDFAQMAHIAAATGGRVFQPADPQTWPAGDAEKITVRETVVKDVWHSYWLLLILTLILGLDWLIRLMRGYV